MFMVITAKKNYNLLLGREWIHGIREVPSIMHQRLSIWREDGIVENIKADQSYYMNKVNRVDRRNFDINLANIGPCYPAGEEYSPRKCSLYFLTLHPNGFQWDIEIMGETEGVEEISDVRPIG